MSRLLKKKHHPLIEALISKKNALAAVMLRDMRSRFFNHGLGFIIVPLWPLVHMGVIILIHSFFSHSIAFGESSALFYATGIFPTLTFIYMSRFMSYSLLMNRQMMSFPVVTALDVLTGRACLEIISTNITLVLMLSILWATNQNPWPFDLSTAVEAYIAVIFLGYAVGALVGVLGMMHAMVITAWQLLCICIYISSGSLFVASNLPDSLSEILSYSPMTGIIEWMRTGFYESYSDKLVFPFYIFGFSSVVLFFALIIERFLRRRLLEG